MSWIHDLRFAWRTLWKSPGFLVVAALSLGLGIALNTTIFGLVHATLFQTPGVERPDRLVNIYTVEEGETDLQPNSVADLQDLRAGTTSFEAIVAQSLAILNIQRSGPPRPLIGSVVTADYFDVLGVEAALGRTFLPAEALGGSAPPTALLTDDYWRREMGADPAAVTGTLRIGGVDFEIVGILPPDVNGLIRGLEPQVFVPLAQVDHVDPMGEIVTSGPAANDWIESRGRRFLTATGRLAEGSTVEAANAEIATLMAGLEEAHPASNLRRTSRLLPTSRVRLDPDLDPVVVPAAMVVMALVGMVLLVACANIGNMLLARAEGRRREVAVRLSLGAGRWQLVRLLLIESLLLGLLGGVAGLALAAVTMRLVSTIRFDLPVDIALNPDLSPPVLLFTLVISLLTGLLFGLVPALQSSRPNLVPALKAESGSSLDPRGWRRWLQPARLMVVGQVALSLVLLVGAGLLQRSVQTARAVDLGFAPERLGVMTVDLSGMDLDAEARQERWRELTATLVALPEIEAAAVATRTPLDLNIHGANFFIPGHRESEAEPDLVLDVTGVVGDYFGTMGLEVLEGDEFPLGGPAEGETRRLAIVNQAMADRFWPGESAVGRTFRTGTADVEPTTIIGIVENHKVRTPGETARPLVHFFYGDRPPAYGNLVYRTAGDANAIEPTVREALLAGHPDLFLLESTTMNRRRDLVLLPIRVGGILVSGLSALALLLAVVGLAGLIAYWVSQRTREIGVRVALGADGRRIAQLVMGRSLGLVVTGGLVGVAGAALLGNILQSVLYVPAVDPMSMAVGLVVLTAAAAAATLVPVVRATRVNPLKALRSS